VDDTEDVDTVDSLLDILPPAGMQVETSTLLRHLYTENVDTLDTRYGSLLDVLPPAGKQVPVEKQLVLEIQDGGFI
jgi:hypothetical protein